MFKYTLPCGGFRTSSSINENGGISFNPPVYEQRYVATLQILEDKRWSQHMKKVIDFGCSEMKLLPLLRRVETIEHILAIDIDIDVLNNCKNVANPLNSDFISPRKDPLRIDILQGSIADPSSELKNTDAVIALEIIEHVYDDVLSKIPSNIFGFMQPKLVIISTPNQEFNVLFQFKDGLVFRHPDHKFEWTRDQFEKWCQNITATYTNYKVSFMGVGTPPPGKEHLGFVSQIAIFARNDLIDLPLTHEESPTSSTAVTEDSTYKLVHSVDYPVFVDYRTKEQKIFDEIQYRINQITISRSKYLDETKELFRIPIKDVLQYTIPLDGTESIVREMLPRLSYVTVKGDFLLTGNESLRMEDDDFGLDSHLDEDEKEQSPFTNPVTDNGEDDNVYEEESKEELWD